MKASMQSPKLIASQPELDKFLENICDAKILAVDSESNSYFAYRPRVCLIQISRNHEDFILDPLALKDISPLGRIFADPSIEKVLHAAENDLIGFKKDFRFQMKNVFDTSVACRLLGRNKLGLARILAEEFGVKLDKKYQRCNWEKRPLSPEQLYYAQLDTHFLIDLRNRLHSELLKKHLWSLAQEEYARLEHIQLNPPRKWDPNGYLRLNGAQELPKPSLRVLKDLSAYRERLARSSNKAPFRVMNNEFMVRVAREMPGNLASLLQVRGLPSRFKGKGAEKLLRVIKRARS
ncbi:MAG: ribonuclease D [Deltaproteobacteria bacterium]|jgi:ribonuclease D|nr:ribonuclease D [Deltaproteobacteria bacterium]